MTEPGAPRRAYGPRGALVLAALDELPEASVMVFDPDLVFVVVRGRVLHELGIDPHVLEEHFAGDVMPPSRWAIYEPLYRGALEGVASSIEVDSVNDHRRRFLVRIGPVRDAEGRVVGGVVVSTDITEQVELRAELERSERMFRLAMSAAPVGMALSDPAGAFVQVNTALCALLGLEPEELLGRTVWDFMAEDERHLSDDVVRVLDVEGRDTMRHEHRLVAPRRDVWVEHSASVLRDGGGRPLYYVHQFADHTEAHELREDLEYRASHDPLTGVLNRGELMTQLAHSLRRGRTTGWLGVLFCDIDNLKPLNDEYGHHTGDVAIATVAARLRASVRAVDLVARIGGDEFVVLLEGVHSREHLAGIAEKCRAGVTGPVDVEGTPIEVSVSVGAVLAAHDESPDEVLARADHALHRAKTGGRRQVDVD